MKLKLVKPSRKYKRQIIDCMEEWDRLESMKKVVPAALRGDYHDFDNYSKTRDVLKDDGKYVPSSTYFCLDEERDIIVGAVNIRHYLNENLLKTGGHIGDGVRPSERGKGIATEMISLALKKCKRLGIDRVLMTCDKDNIASARTIQKNGGVLENEVDNEGETVQRYWIDLK